MFRPLLSSWFNSVAVQFRQQAPKVAVSTLLLAMGSLIVLTTPTDEITSAARVFTDEEYGVFSAARYRRTENRDHADQFASALISGELQRSDGTLTRISHGGLSTEVHRDDGGEAYVRSIAALYAQNAAAGDSEFDPSLLRERCLLDFNYCTSTCDKNKNGVIDQNRTEETTCIAYCTRQAVQCEKTACQAELDSIKRSFLIWGLIFLVAGILITPLAPILLPLSLICIGLSVAPIFEMIGFFRCA